MSTVSITELSRGSITELNVLTCRYVDCRYVLQRYFRIASLVHLRTMCTVCSQSTFALSTGGGTLHTVADAARAWTGAGAAVQIYEWGTARWQRDARTGDGAGTVRGAAAGCDVTPLD